MTVAELIAKLQTMPQDLPVLVCGMPVVVQVAVDQVWDDIAFVEKGTAHDDQLPPAECVGIATWVPSAALFTFPVKLRSDVK